MSRCIVFCFQKAGGGFYEKTKCIKYHVERNENGFRNEAISIARYFDSIGDDQLAEYIMGLIAESNLYAPQGSDYESDFLKTIDTRGADPLYLPTEISEDVKGIINAVNHNVGINKFLFEGLPGSGKTEAAKQIELCFALILKT